MLIIEGAYVPGQSHNADRWPFNVPCIREVVEKGLEFERPITLFVGENGSGKSTLIEALAEAYGLDVRGGHGNRRYGSTQSKSLLGEALRLRPGLAVRKGIKRGTGFFLRAETAYGVFEFMSNYGVPGYGEKHLGKVSHGEGYLQVLEGRFDEPGLFLLDEPEAPLSFHSCLVLIRTLIEAVEKGSQVICATHSPLLAAIPDADIREMNDEGIRPVSWEDLDMVEHWRRYLADPERYLRHLRTP